MKEGTLLTKCCSGGGLCAGSTLLTCVNPAFVAADIPLYYKFVKSYQAMENLEKQTIVPHA